MINKMILLVLMTALVALAAPQMGAMTDSRDGKSYRTVKIGNQVWMAENLDFETKHSYCYDAEGERYKKQPNCNDKKFVSGRLYTYESAKSACPGGWHLPTIAEFETLIKTVGGKEKAGKKLKSTKGWNSYDCWDDDEEENVTKDGNGSDDYGFSAKPVGYSHDETYYGHLNEETYFWCVSEMEDDCFNLGREEEAFLLQRCRNYQNSIRCVKD